LRKRPEPRVAVADRQDLVAGLLDELPLAVSPVLLGRGENPFAGLDLPSLGDHCTESVAGEETTHVVPAK